MKKIIIIGAGLHSEVINNILGYYHDNNIIGYLDDSQTGGNILGKIEDFSEYINNYYFICAIGNNSFRETIYNKIRLEGGKFVNAIHPKAHIENGVKLGEGLMIGAYTYINVGSQIGDNTIINNNVTIEHHNKVGANCHLAPGVVTGGTVCIGNNTFIGLSATIINNIYIGSNNLIGASTLVHKDIKENNVTVYGIPFTYKK